MHACMYECTVYVYPYYLFISIFESIYIHEAPSSKPTFHLSGISLQCAIC
jgi:hypothetical protein